METSNADIVNSPDQPVKSTRRVRRWRWIILGTLFSLLVGWLGSSYLVARHFVSRRSPIYVENLPTIEGMTITEHRLTTRDQQSIGSWFVEGPAGSPIVVLVHGHMGNRSVCLSRASLFHELGCGCMLITMRAHGDSTGDLNDFGYGGRLDVVAAVEFLKKQAPGRPILLVGMSAGATAVCFGAKELGESIAGVVMEQPFQDMPTVVKRRTDLFLPSALSYVAYAGLMTMGKVMLPHYDEIAPVKGVTEIPKNVPIWILAGGKDNRAYPEEAEAIQKSASSHAELTMFPEAPHESLLEHDPQKYRSLAKQWVERVKGLK
ncbi:MAG: alpha/beta hydrolase [Gemmatales bacterium]